MARMTREFHSRTGGPVLSDQHWWRLVLDTDPQRLVVEHAWAYSDARRAAPEYKGVRGMELSEALAGGVPPPARAKLVELLEGLFEAGAQHGGGRGAQPAGQEDSSMPGEALPWPDATGGTGG